MVSVRSQCRTALVTEQGNGQWFAAAVSRGLWMRTSQNTQFTHKRYSAAAEETDARNSPCEPHGVALEHVIVRCIPHGLWVGRVESSGYHEIATIFQAVSLYEEVRASRADTVTVTFEGDDIDTSGLVVDDTNLAIRAARAVAAHTGVTEGVRLEIHKRVPIAGGMGGGSADAAATLVACDELWGTHIPKDDLYDIAATLGADVPFALSGGT